MLGVDATLIPTPSMASASSRVTNRVSACPYALDKLKRQELLDLCTLHMPNMSTVGIDMLSKLTVPGLFNYFYELDEELYLRKIKRVTPALSKMERHELLDLCIVDTPNMSTVEKDMLSRLTVPGLLNFLSKLDEELYQKMIKPGRLELSEAQASDQLQAWQRRVGFGAFFAGLPERVPRAEPTEVGTSDSSFSGGFDDANGSDDSNDSGHFSGSGDSFIFGHSYRSEGSRVHHPEERPSLLPVFMGKAVR